MRESVAALRSRRGFTLVILRFSGLVYLALAAVAAALYFPRGETAHFVRFAAYTAVGTAGFAAWTLSQLALFRSPDGAPVASVGPANYLTIARFLLITPVLVFFAHGHYAAALTVYVLLGLSDVLDGIVARRRGEQTEFGVIMDPLADVFSTAAIFSLFFWRGLVPPWVFGLLMLRYAMLIIGSVVLFLATGPIRYRATIPGKVVGLVQGAGIVVVIACALSGPAGQRALEAMGPVLFPVLGAAFASIVVSQGVIGYCHIRAARRNHKAVDVGS